MLHAIARVKYPAPLAERQFPQIAAILQCDGVPVKVICFLADVGAQQQQRSYDAGYGDYDIVVDIPAARSLWCAT